MVSQVRSNLVQAGLEAARLLPGCNHGCCGRGGRRGRLAHGGRTSDRSCRCRRWWRWRGNDLFVCTGAEASRGTHYNHEAR
jgi:hypothetical protein